MAAIANDLKKIQRVLSLIVRAIERCFDSPEVLNAECGYSDGVYTMKLTANIFNDSVLDIDFDIDVENESSKKCITIFLERFQMLLARQWLKLMQKRKK